jgi:hypothetical protein
MKDKRIQDLKEKIAELKKRWPAHSISAALLQELDDLEEELAKLQQRKTDKGNKD